MIDTKNIAGLYFIGIGGIGMSALARYFIAHGLAVSGYDRYESTITQALKTEGCNISYRDDIDSLPVIFTDPLMKDRVIIIYTPAIPDVNRIISFFRSNGYNLHKRSEILGEISENTDTLAVSGTHGKTTISTMLAHILKQSHIGCSAFLGGISKNYNTNLLIGESRYSVMEADEYDRSFHRLHPWMAVVTSVDADHLDIYGNHLAMIRAYNDFCKKIREGGTLVINSKIRDKIYFPPGVKGFTYGLSEDADFRSYNIKKSEAGYIFDLKTPDSIIKGISFTFPGLINIENATAASAIALLCSVSENELKSALISFKGVQRRFDIRINTPGHVYIDDYAHHPEEIRACITSVKEYFGGRKITGIFQPHLYSRTRDHAEGFAQILDLLDDVILLPVYPAREQPIEGVSSKMILNRMKLRKKKLLLMEDIPEKLDVDTIDILLTIGAGDIDRLVTPIEEMFMKKSGL
jgi:UDP-N-acetylmuramate--alanine ligase